MRSLNKALTSVYEEKYLRMSKLAEGMPEPVFSDDFNMRIRAIIDDTKRKYVKVFRFRIRKTAVLLIAIILIAAMTASTLAVVKPEIRYTVRRMIKEIEMYFVKEDPSGITNEFSPIKPSAPQGYEIMSEEKGSMSYYAIYKNEQGSTITYNQEAAEGLTMGLDAENTDWEKTQVNGNDAMIGRRTTDEGEEWILFMEDDYYVYTVSSNESCKLLMSFAEGIQPDNQ